MVFTNYGRQAVAWALGSDISNNYISYMAIGSGSGTPLVSQTTLINEANRVEITGSPDFGTSLKVGFQADWNSVTMSGINLREFGVLASGVVLTGSIWQRESFPNIVFDGTNELQVVTTLEVI